MAWASRLSASPAVRLQPMVKMTDAAALIAQESAGVISIPDPNATFHGTIALIKADIRRRLLLEGKRVGLANAVRLLIMPGALSVVAYRVSNLLYHRRHRVLTRIIQDLQHLYTGIEIHTGSIIGPGLVYGDRPGGGISAQVTIGKNCTVIGGSTMTLGGVDEIDPLRGRIVIGDYCVIGVNARIIGNVTLAHGTQIKPNAVVVYSMPADGSVLDGIPARRKMIVSLEAMISWNPLRPWQTTSHSALVAGAPRRAES